jgi:sirohydrochlorin ferrochelatase
MANSERKPAALRDPNYLALEQHYIVHPIALYTGAGVSWAKDARYGLRGWDDFVQEILTTHEGPDSAALAEFERRVEQEWADEPWQMAEWVARRCGRKAFEDLVVKIVQREENFPKKWKQLSGRFLQNAPTLNAVCAFCAQLVGVVEGTKSLTYRVSPNPRVRAVVTSNYDPFLEAASSTMFIRPVLKPVGAVGSHVGRLDQIPVFHIHGYVPYPEREKPSRDIRPFVDPVVTASDYEAAWRADDVYCPTMGPQIHVLRHYATLFVGFSFRDRWVNGLLKRLNEEREERAPGDRLYHYALMKRDDVQSKGESFFSKLGVKPIALNDFKEIPRLLGHLYQQALAQDDGEKGIELPIVEKRTGKRTGRQVHLAPAQYWDDLYACRNRAVRRGKTRPAEAQITGQDLAD